MLNEQTRVRLREIVARYPVARSAMLPCLHTVQQAEGSITPEGIRAVADTLGARPDEVESVVTFYSMYHQEPQGRYIVKVCTSISCYLRGCDDLLAQIEQALGAHRGETSPDGRYTIEAVECLAACGMAPVAQVNGTFVEHLSGARAAQLITRLQAGEDIADLGSTWQALPDGGFTSAPVGARARGADAPAAGMRPQEAE